MAFKTKIKNSVVASMSRLTGRHAVLLPPEAGDDAKILDVRAPYRVDDGVLRMSFNERRTGRLELTLLGYLGHFPRETIWTSETFKYDGPIEIVMRLDDGSVQIGDRIIGQVPLPLTGRRFCWKCLLNTDDGAKGRTSYRPLYSGW